MTDSKSKRPRKEDFAAERADLLEKWTDARICAWLLAGFATGAFQPIKMLAEPSAALQIHQIFCAAPAETQARLKAGIARAILEWTPGSHAFSVLAELARVAAHVRASEAVLHLAKQLDTSAIRMPRNEDARTARGFLVDVICGFAPLDQVYPTLLRLYEDNEFEEYGATLFLALCRYDLGRFSDYVPRFLQIVSRRRKRFALDLVMDRFLELVSRPLIDRKLPTLLVRAEPFVQLLLDHTDYMGSAPTAADPPDDDESATTPTEAAAWSRLDGPPLDEKTQRLLFKTYHSGVLAEDLAGALAASRSAMQRFDN
jgi:hypothetical protein